MTTLIETCACGAAFSASAKYTSEARRAAEGWRESHKHAESVGICGDRPPPLMVGDVEVARPYCELKAGHLGAHSDGEGHWMHGETNAPIGWSRTGYGICPKCEQIKFIGHGPLCVDCFAPTTDAREEAPDGAE